MARRIPKLAQSIAGAETRAPYADAISGRAVARRGESAMAAVEREILHEMACSLSRAQQRVDDAFEELRRVEASIGKGSAATSRGAIEQFNEARDRAARWLWELRVHREAIGLARSDALSRDYPLPARRSLPTRS